MVRYQRLQFYRGSFSMKMVDAKGSGYHRFQFYRGKIW